MLGRKLGDYLPIVVFRTMVAVADSGGIGKAADRLGISPLAVFQQIARVNRIVGGEVFERSADGMIATEKGGEAIAIARKILALHDQLFDLGK